MSQMLPRRHALLGSGLLTAAALAAYVATAAAGARDTAVVIRGFAFNPARITIPVGGRITWTNQDDSPHTITSAATPRLFGSDGLDTGDHYSLVFDKPGTYRYYCAIHPDMQGVVVVQ